MARFVLVEALDGNAGYSASLFEVVLCEPKSACFDRLQLHLLVNGCGTGSWWPKDSDSDSCSLKALKFEFFVSLMMTVAKGT